MNILIVDDNAGITDMLVNYLTMKNYQVSAVNDGQTALNIIRNNDFDCILLDLAMPEFTGFDLIDALENLNLLQKQKIFVFTASAIDTQEIQDLLSRGIAGCIKKPVKLKEMLQIIGGSSIIENSVR